MRGDELLRAIIDNPDDVQTRLVYADWLEEQGAVDRATSIRMSCALGDVPDYDLRWLELENWMSAHPDARALPALPEGLAWRDAYRMGFQEQLRVLDVEAFLAHAPAVLGASPIRALDVDARTRPFPIAKLAASPWLARITHLELRLGGFDAPQIEHLDQLEALQSLALGFEGVTEHGFRALLRLPLARRLVSLTLPSNFFLHHGRALDAFRGAALPALRRLDVSHNRMDGDRLRAITENASLALTHLVVSENPIGDAGWRAIAESQLPLEHLDLGKTQPRLAGVRALVGSPLVRTLKSLALDDNVLGPQAAAVLLSTQWPALEFLDASYNRFNEATLARMMASDAFPELQRANLLNLPMHASWESAMSRRVRAWFESTALMRATT